MRKDLQIFERRRLIAVRLFAADRFTRAGIARRLQVSRQSVGRWYVRWQQGGAEALRASGRSGRPPKLSPAQWRRVEQALARGPKAFGYPSGFWTLSRAADIIERLTGVRYHPGHLSKILGSIRDRRSARHRMSGRNFGRFQTKSPEEIGRTVG